METTSTHTSFSQALQFITDIKLQELEKQRLAYQARAKVIDEVKALGELETADILNKVFFFFSDVCNHYRANLSIPSGRNLGQGH
jgi:hypothetical protein